MQPVPPDVFDGRRRRIYDRLEGAAMVLPAAPVHRMSRDTEYPYRPDSELYYVTGMTAPGALAVLRSHADSDRYVLFVRDRDPKHEVWHGRQIGPEEAAERYGADATYPLSELADRLPDLLKGSALLYYRLGGPDPVGGLVRRALDEAREKGQRKGMGPRGVLDPGVILDPMRLVKDRYEIARIREAARISAEAHREAMAGARAGMGEWEVQATLEGAFRRLGGDGPAYGTIVGSGPNACILHYVANDRRIEKGDLVLMDAGASMGLYAGDVSRTFPVDGAFTPAQLAVYEVVDRARRLAVDAIRPGRTVDQVHQVAVQALVEGLIDLGVLEGEWERLAKEEAYKEYFPHQTSHWMGLDVHDVGDYRRDDESRALEPGMVLTVEPGLYFHERAGPGGERYVGIGVRSEDDVLVTSDGHEVLSAGVPTDPDEVADLAGSGR